MRNSNKRTLAPGARIRVLVVDDSVVIRRLVTHALSEDPLIEVVGSASNGATALARIDQLNPDVLTLDVEMPEIDGLELLRRLQLRENAPRVIMFSTLTERGAEVTFEALSLGADDYVAKAANVGSLDRSMASLRAEMVPKIHQFFRAAPELGSSVAPPEPVKIPVPVMPLATSAGGERMEARVVLIGSSTGGPNALGEVIPQFPAGFALPILIVQHMPPLFTRLLAERLQSSCRLKVDEATDGMAVEPGRILIAPGDYHMRLRQTATGVEVALDQTPPENSCRPAVDVLFQSAAEIYGGQAICAVLTGMGRDGVRGVECLKSRGAYSIAQDEATSVVWGMPGSVVSAGLADAVLPLGRIVSEILDKANGRWSACPK